MLLCTLMKLIVLFVVDFHHSSRIPFWSASNVTVFLWPRIRVCGHQWDCAWNVVVAGSRRPLSGGAFTLGWASEDIWGWSLFRRWFAFISARAWDGKAFDYLVAWLERERGGSILRYEKMGLISVWTGVLRNFGEALADRGLVLDLLTDVEGWTFNSPTSDIISSSTWNIFYIVERRSVWSTKRPGSICVHNSFKLRVVGSWGRELLSCRVSLLFTSCRWANSPARGFIEDCRRSRVVGSRTWYHFWCRHITFKFNSQWFANCFVTSNKLLIIGAGSGSDNPSVMAGWPFWGAKSESWCGSLDKPGRVKWVCICSGNFRSIWISHISSLILTPPVTAVNSLVNWLWLISSWAWSEVYTLADSIMRTIWINDHWSSNLCFKSDAVPRTMISVLGLVSSWAGYKTLWSHSTDSQLFSNHVFRSFPHSWFRFIDSGSWYI